MNINNRSSTMNSTYPQDIDSNTTPALESQRTSQVSYVQIDRVQNPPLLQIQILQNKKILYSLDIFQFLPVPRTRAVSTKQSLIGSLIIIGVFIAYVISTFVMFCINNPPSQRLNQYTTPITPDDEYLMPEVAIAFYGGDLLNYTQYDERVFTIKMDQVTQNNITKTYSNTQLKKCTDDDLRWLTIDRNNKTLLCPTDTLKLKGLMNVSPLFQYVRFSINLCDYSKPGQCASLQEIYDFTGGGRIFMYLNQNASVNLASFGTNKDFQFLTYQFFLVPGLYNRAEIIISDMRYIIYPDYFTSFLTRYKSKLFTSGNTNLYVSNVTAYNPYSLFQIWFRLDSQISYIEVVYFTIIDKISSWGALWGVLFGVFALYFLALNQRKFYQKHPQWDQFDSTLKRIEQPRN